MTPSKTLSPELKACPFCGKEPVRVSRGTASCDGLVDGREVHNTIGMRPDCWNARANTRPPIPGTGQESGASADERWLPVVGFENFYEVSNLGRVRSITRRIRSPRGTRIHWGQVMTPVVDRHGYPRVILRIDGKHYTRKVHRLVCEAFNGPPNILHNQVDHIDGDRANAASTNLRWVSHGENMAFRHQQTGVKGSRNGNALLTDEAVRTIRQRGAPVSELAARYGVTTYAIYDVLNGRRWSHVE